MSQVTIRATTPADIPVLLALQREVYPDITPWIRDSFAHQLEVFPQGQLVASVDDRLVGCASSLVVLWDDWVHAHSWAEITSDGTFDNHNPLGRTLYAAEVFVDGRVRGSRVGHALYAARRRLCKSLNLRRIMACGRLPGYRNHAEKMSADEYCQRVVWGDINDPVLSFQLREGFRYCGTVQGYIPEDQESQGHAALIVWLNNEYRPTVPTRLQRPPPVPSTALEKTA